MLHRVFFYTYLSRSLPQAVASYLVWLTYIYFAVAVKNLFEKLMQHKMCQAAGRMLSEKSQQKVVRKQK